MTRALTLLALVLLAATAFAGPDKDAEPVTLKADVQALLARAVQDGYAREDFEDLWRASVLAHGSVEPVLAALAKDEADGARWVEAHLLQRTGRWREAKERYEALAKKDILEAQIALGRAQDALGDINGAWNTWKSAVKRVEDPARIVEVRLAMALLGRQGGASVKDALDEVARQDGLDPALRNRAAIVLALKGFPKEALALFVPTAKGKERFREQIRMADWALAAKEPQAAQGFAWNAYEAATLQRDKRYALTVVVEAHRADKSLQVLIDRFASKPDLDDVAREVWIDLLRETGQVEEAMRLFRAGAEGRFTVDMRRELLEMCRESGEEARLVEAYRELIRAEPAVIEWREGLSRHFLERGRHDEAEAVWASYVEDEQLTIYLLAAAASLQGIGLDETAQRFAETSMTRGRAQGPALLFLFGLHKARGRMDLAEAQLKRLDAVAAPDAPERMQLAESYEQIGKKREAVEILEKLVAARGEQAAGEDLEMHLAWLHSEVGNEERAMERWRALWERVQSVPRRRYVEDRLMAVASRLGKLADIAISLEEKLTAGTADARDGGLLARLYTKANDPVSATEVIEEYMKTAGVAPVKVLVEKSRVFLACTDYHNYEKTIHELIRVDPEGEGDYLRQLAMSQLERGKPDEARVVLARLKDLEDGSDSAEFEAGVLALAGLREEAVTAYRRGIARYPDRIESLLLMAEQMAQTGQQAQAIGMFQHLAATAAKDDLFTIAIDGLLNLDASAPVLRWARRQTLGRLAQRHDKMYLYQLIADLSEEIGERDVMTRSLEAALPIIGERRSSLLRELMDHTKGPQGNRDRHLAYGRRLIGLGEIAPPQVYLDLGKAFLDAGEVSSAAKTFSLATDVPDFGSFQQQIAGAFETAGYRDEALRTYQRLLVSSPGDVALMLKVGELHEQVGRDDLALELYVEAMDLMIARRPLSTVIKEDEKPKNPWTWWAARNVDDFDQFEAPVRTGLLTTLPPGAQADAWLAAQRARLDADLASMAGLRDAEDESQAPLRAWPRIESRAQLLRRASIAFGRADLADGLDVRLLEAYPHDKDLLKTLVRSRLAWGLVASARKLIDASGRPEDERTQLGYLVGGDGASSPGLVSLLEANRLFLPLLVDGKQDEVRALLRRLDFTKLSKEDQELMPVLQSCALEMADGRLALALGRHWIKVLIKKDKASDAPYRFRPVLQKIQVLLDEEQYRSLCEYVVSMILADPEQAGMWLQLIPELQKSFEKPLLDDEQRKALLEKLDGNRWYWIGSFFALVPEADRASVLRTILPKVPASRRMQFLLTLVDQIEDDMQADFADLVVDSFSEAVKSLDRGDQFAWYGFLSLARGATNQPLRLRLCGAGLEVAGTNILVRVAHAVLLKKTGQAEEGLAKGLAALEELFAAGTHYTVNTAKSLLLDEFLPKHLDAFLAAVDKRAAGGGSLDITRFRLDLVRRKGDPLALLAAYRKALEEHPKDAGLQNNVLNQLNGLGYYREAIDVLAAMVKEKPDDKNLQLRLVSAWQRLHHPAKALALLEAARAKDEAKGGEAPTKRSTWVSIRDVAKAVEDGDLKAASIAFRRMWRNFRAGMATMRGMYVVYGSSMSRMLWPVSAQQRTPDPSRLRGGLSAFVEEEEEREEAPSAYEKLAEFEFGRGEMARQMRTWESGQYATSGEILDGVAFGLAQEQGAAEAVKALLAAAAAGTAGKREYGLLLSLFASAPDEVVKDAAPILKDLERTLNPTDAGSLRRLARVWVRLGDTARAARIYRWCGTRASAGGIFYWGARDSQPISAQDLVEEVAKQLSGAERDRTIEAILQVSDPGAATRFGPHVRDGYEALVLQTWIDLVGPDEALLRCRAICDRMAAGSELPQRRTASLAAGLLARAGEIDKAVKCLEAALCTLEPGPGLPAHMHFWFRNGGRLGRADVRRLFPADTAGWKDAKTWVLKATELLPQWAEEERTDAQGLVEPLSILMVRLHDLGETERAVALLPQLTSWASERSWNLLWVIDVARLLGQTEEADRIERRLLEEGRLNFERVPEVLARLVEAEGPEEALEIAEPLAAWTRHERVLEALIETSKAADDAVRAAYWTKVLHDTKAAEAALEALDR